MSAGAKEHGTDDRSLEERLAALIDVLKSGQKGILFSWIRDDGARRMSVEFERDERFGLMCLRLQRRIHTQRLNELSSEDIWVMTEKPSKGEFQSRDILYLDGPDVLGRFVGAVCKVVEKGVDPWLINHRIVINKARLGPTPVKDRGFKSWSSKFEKLMYEDFNTWLELTSNESLRSQ